MDLAELTIILFDILLVMLIIAMYVKLSNVTKKVETFTPAQRWTWARKYRTEPNYLMPSNKQPTEKKPFLNEATNNRGDRSMKYMLEKSQRSQIKGFPNKNTRAQQLNPEFKREMIKSGSNALDVVGYDESKMMPDTSFLPVETQTGVIDNNTPEQFSTNNRANPGFLGSSTKGFFQHNKDNKTRNSDGVLKRKK